MKIIFLCTANSCRSQMAETWARHMLPEHWEIHSAGLITYPIASETRNAMREVGLDMVGQESKSLDGYDLNAFDLVVTLSNEANRFLPRLADPERHLHYPVRDPMSATGTAEQIRQDFARARDQIKELVVQIARDQVPASGSRE